MIILIHIYTPASYAGPDITLHEHSSLSDLEHVSDEDICQGLGFTFPSTDAITNEQNADVNCMLSFEFHILL